MPRFAVFPLLLAVLASAARADGAGGELDLFALDAALAKETTIASVKPRTIRETPGVVTVLSREDLLASGARDLADVLATVPGFQLGVDVDSTLGLGFRGLWGHEGKILVLLDGLELNDLSYGTVPLGNHLPIDEVERIEIIRGPGSALYGGHAELAVVSITTRDLDRTGAQVTLSGGRMDDAFSAATATVGASGPLGPVRASAVVSAGAGARGDGRYRDLSGGGYEVADASRAEPVQANVAARWRDLTVRALWDDYRTTYRDGYGETLPRSSDLRFRTAIADARWDAHLGDRITITPRLTWKRQVPWQMTDAGTDPESLYDITAERATAQVVASFAPAPRWALVGGAEGSWDRAWSNQPGVAELSFDGHRQVSYENVAAFAEAGVDTALANLLAGARFEHHSAFGSSFVPRFAVTRLVAPFHVKALASGAFRAPSIENIHYGVPGLRPERTRIYELEVGVQQGPLYASANVFDLSVRRPIVFGLDASGEDVYVNGARTGSAGVEAEVRIELPVGALGATYAYYDASGRNRVAEYAVDGDDHRLLGFAGHAATAHLRLRLPRGITVSPAVRWLSERRAVTGVDDAGDPAVGRIAPRAVADVFATWAPARLAGLEVGAGVRDLFDAGTVYPQPYRSGAHPPLPGPSREISLRLRWGY